MPGALTTVLAADVAVTSATTILELRVPFHGTWLVLVTLDLLRNHATNHHNNTWLTDSANVQISPVMTQIAPTTNGWWYLVNWHAIVATASDPTLRLRGSNDGSFRSDAKAGRCWMTAIPVVLY